MFFVETSRLLMIQEYVDCVREVVPVLDWGSTRITKPQLAAICHAGVCVMFLLTGKGEMFNDTIAGVKLQSQIESERQKRFAQSLSGLLASCSIVTQEQGAALAAPLAV